VISFGLNGLDGPHSGPVCATLPNEMAKGKVPVSARPLQLALAALFAALLGGCVPPRSAEPDVPALTVGRDWPALVADIRAFERRIGFADTPNFLRFGGASRAFRSCGYVSRAYLPYSYEDPAIEWFDSVDEEQCRAWGASGDAVYSESEALGESATPVTRSMLAASLDRFVYIVVHEDCHDQFALPYGIEEALCNVIAYKAMAEFADERFGSMPRERDAIRRYAIEGAERARLTIAAYERVAAVYAHHAPVNTSSNAFLRERIRIFRRMERELGWSRTSMNNVSIANAMTYTRHYPSFERVFDALGGDLQRSVLFFRSVDAAKPSAADVIARHGLQDDRGVDFLRAYEAAIVQAAQKALAERLAATSAKETLSPPP
jgi:hypothetical protein